VGRIRDFRREDSARVADLYVRAYRDSDASAPGSLRAYFERIYFENPWTSLEQPCHVYENETGEIRGFVGLFPRPMTFEGRPIRVAVLSTIMVDPSERGRSIGLRLMQHAFAGPQDLTFTDGANAACRKLWLAAGGDLCVLLSCNWMRSLRPGAELVARVAARASLRPFAAALRPLAASFDALAARVPVGGARLPVVRASGDPADVSDMLACRTSLATRPALAPVYDPASFRWLLDATAEANLRGRLERTLVRGDDGRVLGWYVYFSNPGGLCDVMQLGGDPATIDQVLLHLFRHARDRGGVVLRGRLEPAFVSQLEHLDCRFHFPLTVLGHARDAAIAQALQAGNTALSRLDGEWWMRFSDGPWS